MEKLNYCSNCSGPIKFLKKHYYCNNCKTIIYLDPKVAVAAIIFQNQSILLVKRAINPSMGSWSFPSGFVDRGEKLEDALKREVMEETNLKIEVSNLIGVYSYNDNPIILCAYEAKVLSGNIKMNHEIDEVKEFLLTELPELAFDHDIQIINDWKKQS
ncbi:MAG: DNA mismatch repair protein MutT [Chloroflexi bacterium]|nr:DNA mismatch repair protein MutT [Chloroflexota bacterium]|tara:strand:+ start:999 stop:1472 length:474 start_codon:yes stop_codon:yes gene_type:complete